MLFRSALEKVFNANVGGILGMFDMFAGGVEELKQLEIELCEYLGLKLDLGSIRTYQEWSDVYSVEKGGELQHDHEEWIGRGMITDFPEWTSPFWNMSRNDDGTSRKIDVILGGKETIGSAERSTDKEQMRDTCSLGCSFLRVVVDEASPGPPLN